MDGSVEIVRRGFEYFAVNGEFLAEIVAPDFVWDMSHFRGWTEELRYVGLDGTSEFLREWTGAWDDWVVELEALHEAGEQVVAVVRQAGISKATRLPVEMTFAMLWTIRDGKQVRMTMYADPGEAMRAAGLGD